MAHLRGTNLGGIRDVEGLRARCYVDECGCWIWKGAVCEQGYPRIWAWNADRNRMSVSTGTTTAFRLSRGGVPDGMIAYRTCATKLCCCPDHVLATTRKKFGELQRERGYLRGDPRRSAVNRANSHKRSGVLTAEQVELIRTSPLTGKAIAAEIGVSTNCACMVRAGRTHRQHVKGSSIFSMGTA